jgi:hypothetical protein
VAFRLEQLEQRGHVVSAPVPGTVPARSPAVEPPSVELDQLQEAWQRTVLPAVQEKSPPTAALLSEARPVALADDTLTVEFRHNAAFHRKIAEEDRNASLLREALYETTGRRLRLEFTLGEDGDTDDADESPPGEDEIYQLVKETFDATEVDE